MRSRPASTRASHLLIENSIFDDVRLRKTGDSTGGPVRGAASSAVPAAPVALDPPGRHRVRRDFRGLPGYRYPGAALSPACGQRVRTPGCCWSAARAEQVGGDPARWSAELGCRGSRASLTGRVSKTDAIRYIAACAACWCRRARDGTNTPLKIYEQLASGKPLVATRIWSHTQVLTDEVCFLVDPEPESMAQGLLAAARGPRPAARPRAQLRARSTSREYARPIYERKIRRLLEIVA